MYTHHWQRLSRSPAVVLPRWHSHCCAGRCIGWVFITVTPVWSAVLGTMVSVPRSPGLYHRHDVSGDHSTLTKPGVGWEAESALKRSELSKEPSSHHFWLLLLDTRALTSSERCSKTRGGSVRNSEVWEGLTLSWSLLISSGYGCYLTPELYPQTVNYIRGKKHAHPEKAPNF